MIKHAVIQVFILLVGIFSVHGQDTINYIVFSGNSKTKTSYLTHFIKAKSESIFEASLVFEDMRRLRTLSGILDVEYKLQKSDSGNVLIYKLKKRWTLLPVGDFGIVEDNYWIGAGFMESNLFKRGVYIYGYLNYSMEITGQFILKTPYILGTKWGMGLYGYNLSYFYSSEMEENRSDLALELRYEILSENEIYLGFGARNERLVEVHSEEDLFHRSSKLIYIKHKWSKIDYHGFYLDGWKNVFKVEYFNSGNLSDNTFTIYDELEFFYRVKKSNFAVRISTGISNDKNNNFLPFVIDSYRNIRGSGYRKYRGNRILSANIEYRLTLFENKHGGIQMVGFTDIGKIYSKLDNSEVDLNKNFLYYGPGLRFNYKKVYNAVLCIDYGFNIQDYTQGGWVIGWGQYF